METKVQKLIVDYFSQFEEINIKAKSALKDCQKNAITINKLINRLKNIKQAELKGTCLEEYSQIQGVLQSKIHNLISEEVQDIRRTLFDLEEQVEKLSHKQKNLTDHTRQLDLDSKTPLVKGTPLQPPLKQILHYSEDTITYLCEVCMQIDTAINSLPIKCTDTVQFAENFSLRQSWKDRIEEIVVYTSFCSENQI